MDPSRPPDPAVLERRLRRERAARHEAEAVAEQTTRELYETIQQLTASKAVLDATTDFVAIADLDGRPTYVNRALGELYGAEPDAVGEINVVRLLTPQSRSRYFDEALPTLTSKGVWRGELAWERPDGTEMAVSQVLIAHRRPDGTVEQISSIARDVTEQRQLQEQLAHQALHDPLTGLANRRLFLDRLDIAQARASRGGGSLGVLYIDLDGFKHVNDTLGHEAGDHALLTVARRLQAHMRTSDTVARLGGDEFAILCEDLTGPDDAIHVAERLAAAVGEPLRVRDSEVTIGASIGIAVALQPTDLDELLQQADAAMYRAKSAGKGGWYLFDGY